VSEFCTLHTGFPGAGKTLFTIDVVEKLRKSTGRPVFYSGIRGLTLPWTMFGDPGPDPERPWETDASKWYECPKGSIIVIDEAQRLMRAGGLVKDPPLYYTKMETLRHNGHDLFLITQDPTLLNAHARKLCGMHRHLMRKFGTGVSTVHEFKGVRDNVAKSRKDSISYTFRFPKELYGCYQSAEIHTGRKSIPWKLVAFAVLVPCVVAFAVYRVFWKRAEPQPGPNMVQPGTGAPGQVGPGQRGHAELVRATFDWASYQPRVPGLPHTAPRYDELTKPVRAPVLVGCVLIGNPGRSGWCITQQGTRIPQTVEFIQSWNQWGMFRDFEPEGAKANERQGIQKTEAQEKPAPG
jgi:zona occludens toxin